MCLLYKSPSDETNKTSDTHFKAPVVHVRVRWIMETPKITQHELQKSVPESSDC